MLIDLSSPDGNAFALANILETYIGKNSFREMQKEFFGGDYENILNIMEREIPGVKFLNDPRKS